MVRALRKRDASEGSLFPMMAGSLDTRLSQRGSKGSGYQECIDKGSGGGSGIFARGNQAEMQIRDLERGREGRQVPWGRLMWQVI